MPQFSEKMDHQQEYAYRLIKNGHNLVITGQGGTGKTHLIRMTKKSIIHKRIQVTCYTGMACQQYKEACTLHKFAGLEDGTFTNNNYHINVMNLYKNTN